MLAFTDLETTGLKSSHSNRSYRSDLDEILEVACIVTDDKLVEVTRFQSLVQPGRPLWDLDEYVRDMHTKSGLLEELRNHCGSVIDAEVVSRRLASFLRENAVSVVTDDKGNQRVERPQLAGNTISFDRGFLALYMPEAEAELHYRNVDVSSFNEVARRFWPKVYDARPRLDPTKAHRAMADAQNSLDTLRYYTEKLGPVVLDSAQSAAS